MPDSWRKPLLGLVFAIGVGLILYALLARQSDAERIAGVLRELCEAVSFDRPPARLQRGLRLKNTFEKLLTERVRIDIADLGTSRQGREEALSLAMQASEVANSLRISLVDSEITVDSSARSASADAVVALDAKPRGAEPAREKRAVHVELVAEGKKWRVAGIEVREPAEH